MKLLIADDDASTRMLLNGIIRTWDYRIVCVPDGTAAWAALTAADPPRIALLDWMMPGREGVSICRELQQREKEPFIYTILLTSRSDREDLVFALDNGAHDFLSKPVAPDELRSRLAVGRRLVESKDKLTQFATQMEELAEARARQLVHADRLAVLGTLAAGLAHEIRNPAGYMAAHAQLLRDYWQQADSWLERLGALPPEAAAQVQRLRRDAPKSVQALIDGSERIRGLAQQMRTMSRRDAGERISMDIHACIDNALVLCAATLKNRVTVKKVYAAGLPPCLISAHEIEQVLINLFINAADAMEDRPDAVLEIATALRPPFVRVSIADNGPGIPESSMAQIWEPFFTTKNATQGTGLGLTISKGIITEHNGTISVENRPEGGARFIIELPPAAAAGPPP